jgi:hypothetical protein
LVGAEAKMRVDCPRLSSYMPRHSWESLITASSNAPQLLKTRSLTAAATVEFGSNS